MKVYPKFFRYIDRLPVKEVLKKTISSRDNDNIDLEVEDAFFVADLGEIYRQHLRWKKLLPRVEPFYAVKCNPDLLVLKLLSALNTGFDCASKSEIQSILSLGVDPSRIIYANPCKQASFIKFASENKVKMMTFDNVEELYKIKKFFPDAQLVLRILTDDSKSLCKLGLKFGAPLDSVGLLLQTAKELELNIIGVSFHVGSGCYDERAFVDAVDRAKSVFDKAPDYGFKFTLLDVGGGFSHVHDNKNIKSNNDNRITFERIASALSFAIDKQFPVESNIRIIAEPGRYYVAGAFIIATHIIARRTVSEGKVENVDNDNNEQNNQNMDNVFNDSSSTVGNLPDRYMYYINDGIYGAFNCIMFDHQEVSPKVLTKDGILMLGKSYEEEPHFNCSIWGPTCDSIDCVMKNGNLPKLNPGDWLYFEEMGAYTICAASKFNGFKKSTIKYTTTDTYIFDLLFDREEEWEVDKIEIMKDKKRHNERKDDREENNKRLRS